MNQLSLDLKFPWEAEQISLDLDFKPCQDYERDLWLKRNADGFYTTLTTNSFGVVTAGQIELTISFRPSNSSVGYWAVGEGLQMHNKKKPSWLHQKMTQVFFGWNWKDV